MDNIKVEIIKDIAQNKNTALDMRGLEWERIKCKNSPETEKIIVYGNIIIEGMNRGMSLGPTEICLLDWPKEYKASSKSDSFIPDEGLIFYGRSYIISKEPTMFLLDAHKELITPQEQLNMNKECEKVNASWPGTIFIDDD